MSKKPDGAVYGAAQHGSPSGADAYYGVRETPSTEGGTAAEEAVYADAGSGAAWFAATSRDEGPGHVGTAAPSGRDGSRAGFPLQSD